MSAIASNNIPPSLRKAWEAAEKDEQKHSTFSLSPDHRHVAASDSGPHALISPEHHVDQKTRPQTSDESPPVAPVFRGRAIVARGPLQESGWHFESVSTTDDIGDYEVVVEMHASGICHTDIFVGSFPPNPTNPMGNYPRVLGHEGSGYVRHVGTAVTRVKPGDPVLLSYTSCEKCLSCDAENFGYCDDALKLNFRGRPTFKDDKDSGMSGGFFGQSSFAQYSIVRENSLVNVKGLIQDEKELALFSPLGCGIQTGAGTVVNAARAVKEDVVVVVGLGGVGLSAVMGAKVMDCRIIVGIDRVQKRLDLAQELGATHVVDTTKLPEGKDVSDVVKEICDGVGGTIVVETTGVGKLIQSAIDCARNRGQILQVGSAAPDFTLAIPALSFMSTGKSYRGVIEGESKPPEFVPRMIGWYREGRFPIDRLVRYVPVEAWERGVHEMHTGETIKPVLLWRQ